MEGFVICVKFPNWHRRFTISAYRYELQRITRAKYQNSNLILVFN